MKPIVSLSLLPVLIIATVVPAQEEPNIEKLQKRARQLAVAKRELQRKQLEILNYQIDLLKRHSPNSKGIVVMQAMLARHIADDQLRAALTGAKIVAADGAYLGRIGPTYDHQSIFCTYGTYGASYSPKSIWCTYGTYGASYNVLSPFCSYATTPPKILVGETVIASLTVKGVGIPVAISPKTLKEIFTESDD